MLASVTMTDSQLLLATFLCVSLLLCGWIRGIRLTRAYPNLLFDQAHRHLPEGIPLLLLMLISVLTLIFGYRSPSLSWFLPVSVDRAAILFLWSTSAGMLSYLGACTASLALFTHREQAKLLSLALICTLLAINSIYLRFYRPRYRELLNSEPGQIFLPQSSAYSCAAAAGASLTRLLGGSCTEREFARLAGTSMQGTNPGQSIFAFRQLGIKAKKELSSGLSLESMEDPAILLVAFPGMGPDSHAVVWVPESLGGPFVHDPYAGRQELTTFQTKHPGKLRILRIRPQELAPST